MWFHHYLKVTCKYPVKHAKTQSYTLQACIEVRKPLYRRKPIAVS